jgi:predicted NUDIX family phosphoesterase
VVTVAAKTPEAVLADADLVILAAPATACLALIDQMVGPWRHLLRPDAIVTDVASTKAMIVERADATGLWFVGGHPMAGRETAGYGAADPELFVDRPWIVVPGALAGANDVQRGARRVAVSDERVFVVPRAAVVDDAGWYGLRTDGLEAFVAALERDGRYEPRNTMEHDPAFKQVIPYLVLRDVERYFLMRRTTAGGDARLHGRYSIGVGGHLNPGDGDLLGGLHREWDEELVADFIPAFRLVALLNDDTTEVGAVHLGAVYLAEASGRPVAIRETHKLSGSFVSPVDVEAIADGLETWSQLTFEFLEARTASRV